MFESTGNKFYTWNNQVTFDVCSYCGYVVRMAQQSMFCNTRHNIPYQEHEAVVAGDNVSVIWRHCNVGYTIVMFNENLTTDKCIL